MEDLPSRLRRETADLHLAVETATGLPHSVRNRLDYVSLLHRLNGFHQAAEAALADSRWTDDWADIALDPGRYRRAHLLQDDLEAMQESQAGPVTPFGCIDDFPRALGCLYVVEGSSLGGRVIGPAIRSAIGDVPTSFFDSEGRGHPAPWRSLKEALRKFGDTGDGRAVVEGARSTFLAFEQLVAAPRQGQA
jgi:heme oxygenase